MTAVLVAQGVSGGPIGQRVIQDVSLTVNEGEVLAVVGPNGAGKSTLLRLLSGWLPLQAGRIWLGGQPLAAITPRERARRIALLPQESSVSLQLTVTDLLRLGRLPHMGPLAVPTASDERALARALTSVGLEGWQHRYLDALSGGERRRVFLAAALAQEPRVLLLDEPTANLDVTHQWHVLELCRQLARAQGLAICLVLHDVNLAAQFADRVVALRQGRVVAVGPVHEVFTPAHLASVFGMRCQVLPHPESGRPVVIPLAPLGQTE